MTCEIASSKLSRVSPLSSDQHMRAHGPKTSLLRIELHAQPLFSRSFIHADAMFE